MSEKSSNLRHPKITISKETTYIEGPLRADGYVDYLAALNEYYSKEVIPENNAAIPFILKAVGPKDVEKETRKKYFQLLGIPELPDEGPYLCSIDDFIFQYKGWKGTDCETAEAQEWSNKILNQYDEALLRPWSKEDFPLLAAILEKNAEPLNLAVKGTRLPRFYSPIVPKDDSLTKCNISISMSGREINRQLMIRATFRLSSGDIDGAWEDILAGHRLARLVSQGPLLLDSLVATALEGVMNSGSVAMAHYGNISAEQARRFQADLLKLPPWQNMSQCLNKGERYFALDALLDIAVNGYKAPEMPADEQTKELFEKMNKHYELIGEVLQKSDNGAKIDWNEVFRYTNNWYNRIDNAYNKPTIAQSEEAVAALTAEIIKCQKQAINNLHAFSAENSDTKTITRQFVHILADSGLVGAISISIITNIENKCKVSMDQQLIILAISGYRSDNKHYPKDLKELCPKYINLLPKDIYSGEDYRYRIEDDGYILYSVGPNLKDDSGKNYLTDNDYNTDEDSKATEEEEAADDIAIRVPGKKNKQN